MPAEPPGMDAVVVTFPLAPPAVEPVAVPPGEERRLTTAPLPSSMDVIRDISPMSSASMSNPFLTYLLNLCSAEPNLEGSRYPSAAEGSWSGSGRRKVPSTPKVKATRNTNSNILAEHAKCCCSIKMNSNASKMMLSAYWQLRSLGACTPFGSFTSSNFHFCTFGNGHFPPKFPPIVNHSKPLSEIEAARYGVRFMICAYLLRSRPFVRRPAASSACARSSSGGRLTIPLPCSRSVALSAIWSAVLVMICFASAPKSDNKKVKWAASSPDNKMEMAAS
mmetsp:Transcript_19612/g.45580  ORF Transcript_19612/g.45580 Transcript_19612/m.45580 type:complete len:278 (-) Transcript_19612:3312-4145(-)